MIDIDVPAPTKTDTAYEFDCLLRRSRRQAESATGSKTFADGATEAVSRFGYRADNFQIRHHEVWDGFYPLFYLTRNGGPLFEREHEAAHIHFEHPISRLVRDFFLQRAADLGVWIKIDATITDARLDQPTSGHVLAFAGGKDSRVVLGALREIGIDPTLVISKDPIVVPPSGSLVTHPVHGVLTDRIMPSLMRLGRHVYVGHGLGEIHRRTPWQPYYDNGSLRGRSQLSGLLSDLGADMHIAAPVSVLPYNITQRILYERYPELYRDQMSTAPDTRSIKLLQVALLKLYAGVPYLDGMDPALFPERLDRFVERNLATPDDHGYRDSRETINLEMRSIVWRMREHEALAAVRYRIPPDWDGPWIDYVHDYVDPELDPAFIDIYRQYAPLISEADPTGKLWRVQV